MAAAVLFAHKSNLLSFGVQSIHTLEGQQSLGEGSWWLGKRASAEEL